MSATADLQQAVLAQWAATPLAAAVPTDRVFAGRVPVQDAHGNPLARPYAQVEVTQARGPQKYVGTDQYIDYRKLVIRVWQAGEAAADALLDLVAAAFAERQALTIPHAAWLRTATEQPELVEDSQAAGDDVWRGEFTAVVWNQRTEP